jgi:MFS transporter
MVSPQQSRLTRPVNGDIKPLADSEDFIDVGSTANRGRSFRWLWLGESINLYVEQFFAFAAPLVVVTTLRADITAGQFLTFLFFLPYLLIGLNVGVWLERRRKRQTIIVVSALQTLFLAVVAASAAAGLLSQTLLAALVLASGVVAVFFQIAYQSYLPTLFQERYFLQSSNAKLAASDAVTRVLGPASAGWLLGLAGVPLSFLLATIAMVLATCAFFRLTLDHTRDADRGTKRRTRRLIREGFSYVNRHEWLNPIIYCGAWYTVFVTAVKTTVALYLVVQLGVSESAAGIVVACIALGYGLGSAVSTRCAQSVGTRHILQTAAVIAVAGLGGSTWAATMFGSRSATVILTGAALFIHGVGDGLFAPTALSVRQVGTPISLMSRVTSVHRFLIWGAMSGGALLASGSTALLGARVTLWWTGLASLGTLPLLYRRNLRLSIFSGHDHYDRDPEVALCDTE